MNEWGNSCWNKTSFGRSTWRILAQRESENERGKCREMEGERMKKRRRMIDAEKDLEREVLEVEVEKGREKQTLQ